ncbi:MAG: hypothetical protein NC331_05110 [Lachnospiraceae bacterium]|nr:hypothetical protein [Lachnospiraceae bacterium]MCM1238745.1 hypothetical protein [Lachnospiraceae bacterium]
MVKTERLEFVIEILTSVMNHWIFFPLVMTALGIAMKLAEQPMAGNPNLLLWTVCGLIPIAFFLVRYYVERFWLFVLCHGAVLAAALAAASLLSIGGAVTCVVCTAAYVIYSFMLRLKENETVYSGNIHPVTALGISVAANFMFHREEDMPDWDGYYLFILIGVFACYLLIHYLKHYLSFLQVNRSSAGYLPAKEILHSGIGFVLPYTLIGALILVLSLNVEWLEPILRVLREGLKIVLRFLIGLLPAGEEPGEPVPIEEPMRGNNDPGLGELPVAETFWLWEVLEYVVIILFFCGCAYVLFKAVKWLIRYIREKFDDRAGYADIVTGQAEVYDIREKCSIEKKDPVSRGGGLFQRFSPVERVRRLYKKRVLSGKTTADDRSGLNFMTARECGDKLSLPDMADIYEQARYSEREITAEDVKRMKLACSGQMGRN